MMYAYIIDGRIGEICCGPSVPKDAVILPADFQGVVGQSVQEFDKKWNLRSLSSRVKDGLIAAPPGYKLQDERLVPMSLRERVASGQVQIAETETVDGDGNESFIREKAPIELMRDGLMDVPEGYLLVESPGSFAGLDLRTMTMSELLKAGLLTQDEADSRNAAAIRTRRDLLLTESDWVELSSNRKRFSSEVNNRWDAYRQALRDITLQESFPSGEIKWPTRPDRLFAEEGVSMK